MEDRLVKIMKHFINSEKEITSLYLSNKVGVTSRTVREDIKKINSILKNYKACIEPVRGKGYRLSYQNKNLFKSFINDYIYEEKFAELNSPKIRLKYILNILLKSKDYIKMSELADELYISVSTLQNDMRQIRNILNKYSLTVENVPHKGIKVIGSELNKRYVVSEYIFNRQKVMKTLHDESLNHLIEFKEKKTNEVWEAIIKVLKANNIILSDIAATNLFVHIIITYKRIKKGYKVSLPKEKLKKLTKTKEFKVAKMLVSKIEEILDIDLPREETGYIAIHLIGTKLVDNSKNIENIIDENVKNIVKKMIISIDREFNFGLINDKVLILELSLHLKPAINRHKYGMNIRNPFLEEIKAKYPLAFESAIIATKTLQKEIGILIDENEIAYIAIHIGAAMERNATNLNPKNVFIICASGAGSSQLIKLKIESEFKSLINVIGTGQYFNFNSIPIDNLDFVISTIPINRDIGVPVVEVNTIIGQEDIKNIYAKLNQSLEIIHKYIKPSQLILNYPGNNKEEVLEELVKTSNTFDVLPKNYLKLVEQREKIASTAYGNFIAIPHPIKPSSNKTFLTIITLKRPIKWDYKNVKIIILLNIEKNIQDDIEQLYHILVSIVTRPELVDELLKSNSYKEFVNILNKYI